MQNQQIQRINWNVLMGLKLINGMVVYRKEAIESGVLIPTFRVTKWDLMELNFTVMKPVAPEVEKGNALEVKKFFFNPWILSSFRSSPRSRSRSWSWSITKSSPIINIHSQELKRKDLEWHYNQTDHHHHHIPSPNVHIPSPFPLNSYHG